MSRFERIQMSAAAFAIAYCLGYVAVDYGRIPRPTYYARERQWRLFDVSTSPVPSGYVGIWLYALALGTIAALGTFFLSRRGRSLSKRAETLLLLWTATAFLLAGSYYTWNNWP